MRVRICAMAHRAPYSDPGPRYGCALTPYDADTASALAARGGLLRRIFGPATAPLSRRATAPLSRRATAPLSRRATAVAGSSGRRPAHHLGTRPQMPGRF